MLTAGVVGSLGILLVFALRELIITEEWQSMQGQFSPMFLLFGVLGAGAGFVTGAVLGLADNMMKLDLRDPAKPNWRWLLIGVILGALGGGLTLVLVLVWASAARGILFGLLLGAVIGGLIALLVGFASSKKNQGRPLWSWLLIGVVFGALVGLIVAAILGWSGSLEGIASSFLLGALFGAIGGLFAGPAFGFIYSGRWRRKTST